MSAQLTGDKQIDKKLEKLETKAAKRVGRKVVNAGLTQMAKGIRSETDDTSSRKMVGKRNKRNRRTNQQEAVAGFLVGNKNRNNTPGWKRVFSVIGTAPRTRKRIGGKFAHLDRRARSRSTGQITPTRVVERGVTKAQPNIKTAMRNKATEAIKVEASKV